MTPDIAAIERLVGNYSVEGKDPRGTEYGGTMRMDRRGAFLHTQAELGALAKRFGLAMPFAGRLVMAFGAKDKVEIGAYHLDGKTVHGMWVPPGAADEDFSKCGREESVVESPGVWRIHKAHAVDQSAYTGAVHLEPIASANPLQRPTPVRMTWKLHDGEYHSFGLAYEDAVYSMFNLADGKPGGVAVYELHENQWRGRWMTDPGSPLGIEVLQRVRH
jgi:hypothetical protein